jgi:hypothetical protein
MKMWERRAINAILGLSVRYVIAPAMTGVPAVGTVVTSGAGAWGAQVDLLAAGAVATEFWLAGFAFDTAGAAQIFEVQVSNATPAQLWGTRLNPTATTINQAVSPVGPYPVYMAAGAQVQCRAGGAAAKVLGVSTIYATGL